MTIKDDIRLFATENGFHAVGFCPVEAVRTNKEEVQKVHPGAKSIIVMLESYQLNMSEKKPSDQTVGFFSGASIFRDYHEIVREKLDKLKQHIQTEYGAAGTVLCDTHPFSDRELATAAGLGFIGRNKMLIHEVYGSMVYIGLLLTELDLAPYDSFASCLPTDAGTGRTTGSVHSQCGTCQLCVEQCPSKALSDSSRFRRDLCVSALTQDKEVDERFFKVMGGMLYGCDRCQQVCPYNEAASNYQHEALINSQYDLEEILKMDNKIFKQTIHRTSAGWIGKKRIQRNALIALSRMSGSRVEALLCWVIDNDPRPDMQVLARQIHHRLHERF